MGDIHDAVTREALSAIRHFTNEIIEKVMETREEAPKDLTDYSDSYHQERVNLGWLPAKAAVEVIEALDEHEAWGAAGDWDKDWRQALAFLAEATYQNAVMAEFKDLMEKLNGDFFRATHEGTIVWELPEPTSPRGVLEWNPNQEREMEAFQRKQQRYQEESAPKIRKKLRKIIDAFITKERP